MAKMFYSLEEAAEKLGKTPEQVKGLASSGQLQEFRDRDRLMFKREQVDLLAEGESGGGSIPLMDSNSGSGLTLSLEDSSPGSPRGGGKGGSGEIGLDENPKERSGISIFDTESTDEGDANAVTRITETASAPELSLESVGSGSGLLDLTREGDDTSLGADLLEDVYKGDESGSETAGSSGLFEPTSAASDVSGGVAMAASPLGIAMVEPYDGPGSGLVGGAAFGGLVVCVLALITTLIGLTTSGDNAIATLVADKLMMWVGGLAVVVVLSIVIGWFLGKRN